LVSALLFRKLHENTHKQLTSLQQKVQLQDDFVATISHELRTPLGFIKGYSTTLLREDTTWDDETRQEFLTIIDEEADRLAQLIDNILESAKLQSGSVQLNLQPLRLDALIRDVVVRVRTRHKNLEVELHLEPVPSIRGDNVRITQVFDNLFSNAIKYANGSKITVTVKEKKGSLLVTFTDRGPGIPKAYLPYIFERFYRVPGERTSKGSGLGLYICNQIIMAHHGKIWVESELKKGTTFYIQLPIKSAI
jgi:signal transduction histidine kinase